jgi:hypothetical protein
MDANHLIALALLILAVPACILITTLSHRARDVAFFTMVAATVITDRLDVNFFSHYWYRGTTRGFEFSLVDLLAIGILAGCFLMPRPGESRGYWPAGLGLMGLFLLYAGATVLGSEPKVYGLFEFSKMIRGGLFFLAAAWFVRGKREIGILVLALACAVCFEGALSIKQRWVGMDRVAGSLGHANSLSMYLCLVGPVLIAATTSSIPRIPRVLAGVAIAAATLGCVLTVSRAGVPIFALVTLGATACCVSWRFTPKKLFFTAFIVLCIAGLSFKTWDSLRDRYAEASFKDEYLDNQQEGRGYYFRLAKVIVADRFFGVGLNNWSFWVSKKYGAMVGRPYDDYDDLHTNKPDDETIDELVWAAPAHNLAALTVGELGVPGLILFALLWGRWFQLAAPFLFNRTPDAMRRLGTGIFFGLCGIFLQSLTEWTFRQSHIFLTFNILVGTLASLCYSKHLERKRPVEAIDSRRMPRHGLVARPRVEVLPCA